MNNTQLEETINELIDESKYSSNPIKIEENK